MFKGVGEKSMKHYETRKAGLLRSFPWKPIRFIQLFLFIIVVMLLSPVLHKTPLLTALLSIFFLNLLIVTLSFAGFDVRRRWPLILLWFLVILMDMAAVRSPTRSYATMLEAASDLANAVLIVICVVMILRYVLTSHEVTVDTVFGAIVAYFLIALTFSSLYQALAVIEPNSFALPDSADTGGGYSRQSALSYFSFDTIATLGYGDIVPRLPAAQMLSILEAVTGQFYMAVVVAWLVSNLVIGRKGH